MCLYEQTFMSNMISEVCVNTLIVNERHLLFEELLSVSVSLRWSSSGGATAATVADLYQPW